MSTKLNFLSYLRISSYSAWQIEQKCKFSYLESDCMSRNDCEKHSTKKKKKKKRNHTQPDTRTDSRTHTLHNKGCTTTVGYQTSGINAFWCVRGWKKNVCVLEGQISRFWRKKRESDKKFEGLKIKISRDWPNLALSRRLLTFWTHKENREQTDTQNKCRSELSMKLSFAINLS
jgi:hypothetical protein